MVRGLGYLRSLSIWKRFPSPAKMERQSWSGISERYRRTGYPPRRRRMERRGRNRRRHCRDALRIERAECDLGVKSKSSPKSLDRYPREWIVSGYDRSGLIDASIDTLKRDLIEEAVIVSLVIVIFLFHLPFSPYSDPDTADRRGRIVHSDVLPADQLEHPMFWADWRWLSGFWWTRRS